LRDAVEDLNQASNVILGQYIENRCECQTRILPLPFIKNGFEQFWFLMARNLKNIGLGRGFVIWSLIFVF